MSAFIGWCVLSACAADAEMSSGWHHSILCAPAGCGPSQLALGWGIRVHLQQMIACASVRACYMSGVLQKTLPTGLGDFLQFCIFMYESLNMVPFDDSSLLILHFVFSHAFSRKTFKLCFFFLIHQSLLRRLDTPCAQHSVDVAGKGREALPAGCF